MSDPEQPMVVGGGLSLATTTGFMVAAALVVFLLFVFIFAVYLHAKRCYGADPVSAPRARARARLVFAEAPSPGAAARQCGLGADAIAALPSAAFRAAGFKEGVDCAVCLCQLAEGEAARQLPRCGHLFHVACVDMWLLYHSTCPLCRSVVAARRQKAADSGADSSSSGRAVEMVVEIPTRRAALDGAAAEEEVRSPTAALRLSLRRMLSRGSIAAAGASTSPLERDIEQGCLRTAKTPVSSSMHD